MGSLNNGQHISKDDKVVRHTGEEIVLSTLSDDTKIASKYEMSYSDKLRNLEESIKSMPSRVCWLDASDASTITVNGNGKVTKWTDKTGNGLYADDSDGQNKPSYVSNAVDVNGILRNAIRFVNGDNLSLGEQLDSEITGAGKSWTFIMALKPINQFTKSNDFIGIINKFKSDGSESSFYLYFFDDASANAPATYRTEVYAGNNFSNGVNIRGGAVDLSEKDNTVIVLTSLYDANGGDNEERLDQYINRKQDIENPFMYGTGMGDITDNGDPLTIGRYSGGDLSGWGYSSFNGFFCELLIFNEPLSPENRKTVEHYLGMKWGAAQYMDDIRLGAG